MERLTLKMLFRNIRLQFTVANMSELRNPSRWLLLLLPAACLIQRTALIPGKIEADIMPFVP